MAGVTRSVFVDAAEVVEIFMNIASSTSTPKAARCVAVGVRFRVRQSPGPGLIRRPAREA
jgi:hypothetical protein